MKSSSGILHDASSFVSSSKTVRPPDSMYCLNAGLLSFATSFLSQSR